MTEDNKPLLLNAFGTNMNDVIYDSIRRGTYQTDQEYYAFQPAGVMAAEIAKKNVGWIAKEFGVDAQQLLEGKVMLTWQTPRPVLMRPVIRNGNVAFYDVSLLVDSLVMNRSDYTDRLLAFAKARLKTPPEKQRA